MTANAPMLMFILILTLASSSARGDDCSPATRRDRCESQTELLRARSLQRLDCAGLTGYVESQRLLTNARIHAVYLRAPVLVPIRTPRAFTPTPLADLKSEEVEPKTIEPDAPPPPPVPPAMRIR